DRELGPDAGDRLGDQELMAGRHHPQRRAPPARREPGPPARGPHPRARAGRAPPPSYAPPPPPAQGRTRGRRPPPPHRAPVLGGPAVPERKLRRLDVAVGRAPRHRDDAAVTQDRQPPPRLCDRDELDRHAGSCASRYFAGELLGVALGPRDLESAALREAKGLAGLVAERRQLRYGPLRELGEGRGGANLAREAGGTRRGLRGERGALEHRHPDAPTRQVVRRAGAEGAGADHDDVGRGYHGAQQYLWREAS